jgi:hypothetical protein
MTVRCYKNETSLMSLIIKNDARSLAMRVTAALFQEFVDSPPRHRMVVHLFRIDSVHEIKTSFSHVFVGLFILSLWAKLSGSLKIVELNCVLTHTCLKIHYKYQ